MQRRATLAVTTASAALALLAGGTPAAHPATQAPPPPGPRVTPALPPPGPRSPVVIAGRGGVIEALVGPDTPFDTSGRTGE